MNAQGGSLALNSGMRRLCECDSGARPARHAGQVTSTAGTATADGTVGADALPLGTVIWANPGSGAGVYMIVPAVPSPDGVADDFAFQCGDTARPSRLRALSWQTRHARTF
jgi:hypothetical protein